MSFPNTIFSDGGMLPKTCEFCGKALNTVAITVPWGNGTAKEYTVPCYASCGCEGAKAKMYAIEHPEEARRMSAMGVPTRYVDATAQCGREVKHVIDGGSVYVYGSGNGSGKSYFAAAMANVLSSRGKRVEFVRARDAISDECAMERAVNAPIAVIDDIGKEVTSEYTASRLFGLVDERYSAQKPTVYTSNYSVAELAQRIAQVSNASTATAIASRLNEDTIAVELDGADRRIGWESGTPVRDSKPV